MRFEEELAAVLPADLPHRAQVIAQCGRHLALIVETNRQFNLTRITDPREAAIKHVLDSLLPWRHFVSARHVLDTGSGAGFPGIPLSLVLPGIHFTLAESTGKKAAFLAAAVATLQLANVDVAHDRAERNAQSTRPQIITGRAFAPLPRSCILFADAVRAGARILLYKGPDARTEMLDAAAEARKAKVKMRIVERYDLPDGMGERTLVELA